MKKILIVTVPDTFDESNMYLKVIYNDPALPYFDSEINCDFKEFIPPSDEEVNEAYNKLVERSSTSYKKDALELIKWFKSLLYK